MAACPMNRTLRLNNGNVRVFFRLCSHWDGVPRAFHTVRKWIIRALGKFVTPSLQPFHKFQFSNRVIKAQSPDACGCNPIGTCPNTGCSRESPSFLPTTLKPRRPRFSRMLKLSRRFEESMPFLLVDSK